MIKSTPNTMKLLAASIVAAVVGLSLGFSVSGLGASADGVVEAPREDPALAFNIQNQRTAISADVYWAEALEVVDCLDKRGLNPTGPLPSEDGENIEYSFDAKKDSLQIERDCSLDYFSTSIAYSRAKTPDDAERLQQIRETTLACIDAEGGKALQAQARESIHLSDAADGSVTLSCAKKAR